MPRKAPVIDLARARAAEEKLHALVAQHPELTSPESVERMTAALQEDDDAAEARRRKQREHQRAYRARVREARGLPHAASRGRPSIGGAPFQCRLTLDLLAQLDRLALEIAATRGTAHGTRSEAARMLIAEALDTRAREAAATGRL